MILNVMLGRKLGGLERTLLDTSLALRGEGHAVMAVTRRGAAMGPLLREAGIPLIELPAGFRWNPFAQRRFRQALRTASAVLLHGNRAAVTMAHFAGEAPAIAFAHSRFFTPHPYFSAVIALSESRAEQLRTQLSCPVEVVPNMVEVPVPMPTRPAWRSPPVIGTMARFSPEKGIDLLLDALAILTTRGVALRAVIGGDGPERTALQAQAQRLGIAERIDWPGWITDKVSFYASIDLFVLPSRSESFSLALVEAMAHALPTVATDCGGPSSILTPESGMLTGIDSAALAETIACAWADPKGSAAMGSAAYQRAVEHYSTPVVARQLAETIGRYAR